MRQVQSGSEASYNRCDRDMANLTSTVAFIAIIQATEQETMHVPETYPFAPNNVFLSPSRYLIHKRTRQTNRAKAVIVGSSWHPAITGSAPRPSTALQLSRENFKTVSKDSISFLPLTTRFKEGFCLPRFSLIQVFSFAKTPKRNRLERYPVCVPPLYLL